MDKCLIEELFIQANEGMKIDKGFKAHAYVAAANALRERFNININKDHVINRMKTIKQHCRDVEMMISQSGITFNYTTKQVECTDSVWEAFVKAHPKLKKLRHKCIEMLDELMIVCGIDAATGEWCRGGPDINGKRTTGESEKQPLNESNEEKEQDNIEKNGGEETANQRNKRWCKLQMKAEGTSSKSHDRSTNAKCFVQTMNTMANSIHRMAQALEKKPNVIDPNILLDCLRQINGIDEDDLFNVFGELLEHETKAKAFLALPRDMRIKYLKKEFKIKIDEPIVPNSADDFINLF